MGDKQNREVEVTEKGKYDEKGENNKEEIKGERKGFDGGEEVEPEEEDGKGENGEGGEKEEKGEEIEKQNELEAVPEEKELKEEREREKEIISISQGKNANIVIAVERTRPVIHFAVPELNIEKELDPVTTREYTQVKRKVQICCTDEKHILSFYWTKMAKQSDEILLVQVIRDCKTETEAEKEKEHLSRTVGKFIEECKLQGILCKHIVPVGNPGEVICEVATQFKPHFVMIGSNLNKKQGSASKHVLRNSPVPVLTVPIVREHVGKGFSAVAAVAQAAIRFGFNEEKTL